MMQVVAGDAGVVDQDVQPAPELDHLVDHFVDALGIGHVGGDRFGRAAGGADAGNCLGEGLGVDIDAGHLGTRGSQIDGEAPSQAPRRTGDQGPAAGQIDS